MTVEEVTMTLKSLNFKAVQIKTSEHTRNDEGAEVIGSWCIVSRYHEGDTTHHKNGKWDTLLFDSNGAGHDEEGWGETEAKAWEDFEGGRA